LAQLEQLVSSQQDEMARQATQIARQDAEMVAQHTRITEQQEEISQLRAPALPMVVEASAPPMVVEVPAATNEERVAGKRSNSRRALLKLGGAAAAAGVAAAAAGAMELAHPSTAQAHFQVPGSFSSNVLATPAVAAAGTNGATGVSASSDTGVAVFGQSGSSRGVVGFSVSGDAALYGSAFGSAGYGAHLDGVKAPLFLTPHGSAGPPQTVNDEQGALVVDSNGDLWLCIANGFVIGFFDFPGTWIRLSGGIFSEKGGAIRYLNTPVRLLDARTSASSGLTNRGALAGNELYTFVVAGTGGIPSNAQGLIGNVTILGPSGAGNLSLFPAGGSVPTVASMTFGTPGLFLANGVNVAIGSGGAIDIQNQSSGTTPLVLDAVAYVY
jgi:hypothetical protein